MTNQLKTNIIRWTGYAARADDGFIKKTLELNYEDNIVMKK